MIVVRSLKLVLDDYGVSGVILTDEVSAESAGGLLALDVRQVEIEDVIEDVDVLFQPRREVARRASSPGCAIAG